jgi:hypothetical protein
MRDALLGIVLLLFGFSCVGCEVFGAYEFLWSKFGEWNYLVVGGMLVTSLAGVLPLAAEHSRRTQHYGKMIGCWLAIPLALLFVFTAAVERTGLVADTDEASRKLRAVAIATAQEEIEEAKKQIVKDQAAVDANCKVWGPICTQAKADLRATEAKLAAGRIKITKSASVTDNSMAKRIVAVIPGITEQQVQLYHPLLLPILLGLLGSLCVAAGGAHGTVERAHSLPVESKPEPIAQPQPVAERFSKPQLVPKTESYKADVHRIMKAALVTTRGERADLGQCLLRYQADGGAQCTPNDFMLCVVAYCKASKIRTEEIGGRIYLIDVALTERANERSEPQRLGPMGRGKRT